MVMSPGWYLAPLVLLLAGCGATETSATASAPEPRAASDASPAPDMACRPGDQVDYSLDGEGGAPSAEEAAATWAQAGNASGLDFGAPATGWTRTADREREAIVEAGGVEVVAVQFVGGGWAVSSARCLR